MPGTGKYTNYSPRPSTIAPEGQAGAADVTLLKKLYATPAEISNQAAIVKSGNTHLFPHVQGAGPTGNQDFPNGVYLDYQNPEDGMSAPDIINMNISDDGAGGPSTPFTPNLASPDQTGGNSTAPVPATILTIDEVKKGAVVGINGTLDPKTTSSTMYEGSLLGKTLIPGQRPKI